MEDLREYFKKRFDDYVIEGIDALPSHILDKLQNVAIVVEDKPTSNQKKKLNIRKNEVLFGLYEGIPRTERGCMYQGLPDKITIFKEAIIKEAKDEEDLKSIVKTTVWHEVAHHFGMDEEEVRREERKRGY